MEKDYLLISGIQHFSFCRRQWALIHIENQWKENQLTAEGKVLHERVHDSHVITKRKDVITLRGIPVRSEELMIVGECDAVELIPDENGFELKGRTGKWHIHPVEYKRGKTKSDDCDRLQLAAECMCLEEMLSCHVLKGQRRHVRIVLSLIYACRSLRRNRMYTIISRDMYRREIIEKASEYVIYTL